MSKKIFILICIILCILTLFVYANNVNGERFKPGEQGDPDVKIIGDNIIGITRILGTIVALATMAMLGIKLMITAPSEKAEIKSKMVPYLVGACMIFSIVQLLSIVYNIIND